MASAACCTRSRTSGWRGTMLLGACNSPYTEIPHVLGRAGWGCPKHYPSQSGLLRADTRALGYDNVHLHYTKRGDPVRYLHRSVPDNGYAERYYVPQILAGTHPEPMPGGWWGGTSRRNPSWYGWARGRTQWRAWTTSWDRPARNSVSGACHRTRA